MFPQLGKGVHGWCVNCLTADVVLGTAAKGGAAVIEHLVGLFLLPCGLISILPCLLLVCRKAASYREYRLQGLSPGWERFSRVLASQACRPKFGSQNSCRKWSQVVWHRLVVSAMLRLEVEIGSSQKPAGQLACLSGKVPGQ